MYPPDEETRYWRDIAMEQGHEQLDPDYIKNAVKDIYENYLGNGALCTPHTPAWTVTPVMPILTPHSAIRPLPQTPRHFSSSLGHATPATRFHPSPTPDYQYNPPWATFGNTEHDPNHHGQRIVNQGIGSGQEIIPRPQWRPSLGLLTTPHHRSWHELPVISNVPHAPPPSPSWTGPLLPTHPPDFSAWRFPAGTLTWSPHPHPHPSVPATTFWVGNTIFGQGPWVNLPTPGPAQPLGPGNAARLTGGWPLPGTCAQWPQWCFDMGPSASAAMPQWSPGTWPLMPWPIDVPVKLAPWLIPNPLNSALPQLEWDVSTPPSTARRITGAHVNLPLDASDGGSRGSGISGDPATAPSFNRILVLCDVGMMNHLWGPIVVEPERGETVTVRDLLDGIYAFFQIPLTRAEVEHISSLGTDNYHRLVDAYRKRTTENQPRVRGLREWEWRQGLRRVDCLGDRKWWWGTWVTYNSNGTWHLNLGLVNPMHRYT